MPELPEVETVARDLRAALTGKKIVSVWHDRAPTVLDFKHQNPHKRRYDKNIFLRFEREVSGKKILGVERRAKNILISLEGDTLLLAHLKMTGRFLFGDWNNPKLCAEKYVHLVFNFNKGQALGFSDVRKFGKILWGRREEIMALPELAHLGPEPLSPQFNSAKLKALMSSTKTSLKRFLTDPYRIAGIGSIYADEILWRAKLNPFAITAELNPKEILNLYRAIKTVLSRAVRLRGTSMRDYLDTKGKKGSYYEVVTVYGRTGEKCFRCSNKIVRVVQGGRSTHFCPTCQI